MLTPLPNVQLLRMFLDEEGPAGFRWKKGKREARGHHRAEFRLSCGREACDAFFSGVSGIRAHYYRSIDEGEALTRYLMTGLADALVSRGRNEMEAIGIEPTKVRASLCAVSAKIWIDEDASTLNRNGVDAESLITIEVPHWVKAAKEASTAIMGGAHPRPRTKEKALLGVQAPECQGIAIFGAWLRDDDAAEFRVPSKRNRARHIRVYGFS